LKVYEKIDSLDWYRLDSIKREIRNLGNLNHENVVHLYHTFKDKKKIYLLMDNGGKQSLSGLLRKSKTFSEERAKGYFKQALEAIGHCHEKGVCHRDLKPENILVDE
jgi:5'-AMP-activated protein kinase catalytic alpha subunit